MTLEEYLKQQVVQLGKQIAAQAPVDCCPNCNISEAYLVYDNDTFVYECRTCGLSWSPENLDVDKSGNFQVFELAD